MAEILDKAMDEGLKVLVFGLMGVLAVFFVTAVVGGNFLEFVTAIAALI